MPAYAGGTLWQDPEFSAAYPSDILTNPIPAGGAAPAGAATPAPVGSQVLPGAGGLAPDTLPGSVTVFTGPAKTPQELAQIAMNDPNYLQKTQWNQEDFNSHMAALGLSSQAAAQNLAFTLEGLGLSRQAAQQSAQNALAALGASDAAAAAQGAFEQEKGARAHERDLLTLHEVMAGRGIAGSGQEGVETKESNLQFGEFVKGIQMELAARQAQSGIQRAGIQGDLANRMAQIGLDERQAQGQAGITQAGIALDRADYTSQFHRAQGGLLMDTLTMYSDPRSPYFITRPSVEAVWSPSHGAYQASNGQWYDANGTAIAAPPELSEPYYLNS